MNPWLDAGYTPRHPWPELETGFQVVRVGELLHQDDEFNPWCPYRHRYLGWLDVKANKVGTRVEARGAVYRRSA